LSSNTFQDGNALHSSSNLEFNDDKTVLNIKETKLTDEGNYSCVAYNSAGNATQLFRLYVGCRSYVP